MDGGGGKHVCAKGGSEVDRLSNLPESLIYEVLLKLETKYVVRCSVLSSRWRNMWKYIPKLDLEGEDFKAPVDSLSQYERCVSFVDRYLGFNRESCLQTFRVSFPGYGSREPDNAVIMRWMDTVIKRKVKHLEYLEHVWESDKVQIPPTIYTCESLEYLKLYRVTMPTPDFVSLPFLKAMHLIMLTFPDDLAIEKLISSCLVLENLAVTRNICSDIEIQVLRVCSESLLRFTLYGHTSKILVKNLLLVIDAPRLEYLRLNDHQTASFIIKNPGTLAKVNIDVVFGLNEERRFDPCDLPKRNMIRNFIASISCVKVMTIFSDTLEIIYDYLKCEPLPLFRNLSSLRVRFTHYSWEMLTTFLETCPNLKSLVLEYIDDLKKWGNNDWTGPRCFLSNLEYVEIYSPVSGDATEKKLVSYFLQNSTILKKLTLCLHSSIKETKSVFLKEVLTIPRLSTSCQVVFL